MENFTETVESREITKELVREQFEQDREDVVYLPIGVKYDGQVIRLLKIKEPDGFTEELQSSDKYRKQLSTVINATLIDCIVDMPEYDLPSNRDKAQEKKEEIVKLMAESDRQYVMARLYKYEHGSVVKSNLTCKHCQAQSEVEVNIDEDFKIHFVDDATLSPQDDRMVIKDIELTHPITIGGKSFDKINVRMPNGATGMSLEKSDNMGQVVTKMILQMIACNLDKFIPNETDIKKWSKKVRHGLIGDVGERRIGFINSVSFACEKCNKTSESPVQVTSFLGS